MFRRTWPVWAMGAVLSLTAQGSAQATGSTVIPAAEAQKAPEVTSVETGGKTFVETLILSSRRFSQALRFGAIKKGSESVDLGGRTLSRGRDYEIDYPSGTLYIKTQFQEGQNLRISYRYDESKGQTGTYGMAGQGNQNGFNGFTFQFAPGASAFVGLGLTERLGDGTVLSSNVYGLSNSFKFGPGTLKGVFMLGDRQQNNSLDMMTGSAARASVEEGQGRALVQNLQSSFLGGTVNAYYQDVDTRFGGFQAFGAAGFTQDQVAQISREKGLKRSSFAFNKVGLPNANFSNTLEQIGDKNGSVTRRTAEAVAGGLKLNWWSQKVDSGFSRFQDIGAADWQQLAKERDLRREGMQGTFLLNPKAQVGFSNLKVDAPGGSVRRTAWSASLPSVKFSLSEQEVEPGFNRFGDLRGDEFNGAQLAQEQGMIRRNMAMELTPGKGQKIEFKKGTVRDPKDDYASIDLNANLGRLNLAHSSRKAGENFTRLGSLGGPDIGAEMSAMLNMTEAGLGPQGNDVGGFLASAGIERNLWRGGYDFGQSLKVGFEQLKIANKTDGLSASRFNLDSKNLQVSVKTQKTGEKFGDITKLMASEQARLGSVAGFSRQDVAAKMNLGGQKKLEVTQLKASDPVGDLTRAVASYSDKGFSVNYSKRDVDAGMTSLASLFDPERDLLYSLAGYSTSQTSLRWDTIRGLSIEAERWQWAQKDGSLNRDNSRALLKYSLDKKTTFEALLQEHIFGSSLASQINQRSQRYSLARSIDGFGKITLLQHSQEYDGDTETLPDSMTRSMVLETKLNKSTGLVTEQSETRFENGERETRMSNTLSTELNKRTGVSVTETQVNRGGDQKDEVHRQYGVWYDFGKGIRLKYGYSRDMNGQEGALNSGLEVTPGTAQDVKVDAASYQQVRQDDIRDQHIGRVSLSNARPLQWGFINDVRFYYNADTYRDRWAWQRENRSFGFGATRGQAAFGFDYNSQVAPTGDRAIDRFFSLISDRSGKQNFVATLKYGVRTLPNDQNVMIRDYSITWKPTANVVLNHAMVTNPLANQNGVLLGTIAQPLRTNSWNLTYEKEKDVKAGLFWKENQDENRLLRTREGGINLLLRASNPSPIRLTYGVQQTDQGSGRMTAHKFGLYFTQRPGPNQNWTFFFENLNWQHGRPQGTTLQNWNMRMDYSWRF